jgi:hypothetical protein
MQIPRVPSRSLRNPRDDKGKIVRFRNPCDDKGRLFVRTLVMTKGLIGFLEEDAGYEGYYRG